MSYKAANSNSKEVQFRLKFCAVLLIDTYPAAHAAAAAARRSGRTCRFPLGAWVLVNAKALGPQEGLSLIHI